MVWCFNPRFVFIYCGDRKQNVRCLKYLCYHAKINCTSSISFHLRNCPCINNLTLTCTNRQIQCNVVIIPAHFILFFAKPLQPQFLRDILILLISDRNLFSLFCCFFLQIFPQVSKHSAMLDQWPPMHCQQKTVSKAKSKQSSWGPDGKGHNWITAPWGVCGTMPTHLPFCLHLLRSKEEKVLPHAFYPGQKKPHIRFCMLSVQAGGLNMTQSKAVIWGPLRNSAFKRKHIMWLNGEWSAYATITLYSANGKPKKEDSF